MTTQEFATLYREHHRKLYCFMLTLCKNRDEAEDVTARAFMRAWEHREQLNGNFKPWLYQIAVNEMKMIWRKSSHLKMEPLEDHYELADPRDFTRPMAEREEWQRAAQAVTLLPAGERRAMACACLGLDLEESARSMRVCQGTAGRRLFGARKRINGIFNRQEKRRALCLAS